MLPEQQDILWTFLTLAYTFFAFFAFGSVIKYCREREGVNTALWGGIFGVLALISFFETVHMFDLTQQEQITFFFQYQVLTVFVVLLCWGVFFKSQKIEDQSPPIIRAFFFWSTVSVLLAGYTNWLPQQRSDPPPKAAAISEDLTMEEYVEMGRVIVFGAEQVAGQKSIGKGQCPLCHTFLSTDHIGRCPNLFGIEERSKTRIEEERYKTSPVAIGEKEPASGIIKGVPGEVPAEYRRAGAGTELTGEDYIRESLMCPTCYVVQDFGNDGDTKSPMPVISKPPISLTPVEVNAVIAYLQSKETPGDFANVTVPLPSGGDAAAEAPAEDDGGEKPVFVVGTESIDEMINTLGCPLCHTIPGVEGAVGELGPVLHEKLNAPSRMKDPNYKGSAKTVKEYVRESILDPSAYVVFNDKEGAPYPDGLMPTTFGQMLSVQALDKLVDFISQTEAPPEG